MKLLNDIATGTLCGAMGFFSAKMPEIPVYSQIISSIGFALVFNGTLYCHPYFKPEEHKVIGTVFGILTTLAVGWTLHYGFNLQSYVINPLLTCSALLLSIIAASLNVDYGLNTTEMRELVRVAASLTVPESPLRQLTLEAV